jgi:hypothetical protein
MKKNDSKIKNSNLYILTESGIKPIKSWEEIENHGKEVQELTPEDWEDLEKLNVKKRS